MKLPNQDPSASAQKKVSHCHRATRQGPLDDVHSQGIKFVRNDHPSGPTKPLGDRDTRICSKGLCLFSLEGMNIDIALLLKCGIAPYLLHSTLKASASARPFEQARNPTAEKLTGTSVEIGCLKPRTEQSCAKSVRLLW